MAYTKKIALLGTGAMLALALAGCSTNGAARIASIGASDIAQGPGSDGGAGGTTGDGEGTKTNVMNDSAMTGPGDGTSITGGAGTTTSTGGTGGAGGTGSGGGSPRAGGGGSGSASASTGLAGAVLVTAGNAVLTGSGVVGGIGADGPVATVQGRVTQLLDRTGTALVDLGNGQSALIQQAGATVGSVINVSTPAGSLLPGNGQPGAVGVALLSPNPAVGTVAAVSVLPTNNSGQLASALLSGTPIASAIAATTGAVALPSVGGVSGVPASLVAANIAGTSIGGGQPVIAANILSPTQTSGTLATVTVAPTALDPVTGTIGGTVASVTQVASAVPGVAAPAVAAPAVTAPAVTAIIAPSVAIAPSVTAPIAAIVAPGVATVTAATIPVGGLLSR